MADIAFVGLWVGIIGIAFIAWTLIETRSAAFSARETLRIAEETLGETREANKAVVTMSNRIPRFGANTHVTNLRGSYRVPHCIEIFVEFKNYGLTPAHGVNVAVFDVKCLKGASYEEPDFDSADENISKVILPPGQPINTASVPIYGEELNGFLDGSLEWVIFAELTYYTSRNAKPTKCNVVMKVESIYREVNHLWNDGPNGLRFLILSHGIAEAR